MTARTLTRADADAALTAALAWASNILGPKRLPHEDARALRVALEAIQHRARVADPPIQSSRITELYRAAALSTSDLNHTQRAAFRGHLRTAQTIAALVRWGTP
jgi:hypothetical protein